MLACLPAFISGALSQTLFELCLEFFTTISNIRIDGCSRNSVNAARLGGCAAVGCRAWVVQNPPPPPLLAHATALLVLPASFHLFAKPSCR